MPQTSNLISGSQLPDHIYDNSGVDIRLCGTATNYSSWVRFMSSSRLTMLSASHLPQTTVIKHSTPRRISTRIETEYGKYTTSITMPVNGNVIKTIPKYHVSIDKGGIEKCPSEVLIYDNRETGEVCSIMLDSVRADHVTFGYQYRYNDVNLNVGAALPKGTVIASSDSLKENGEYNIGVEANVVFMSHPACIEDGVLITDAFAAKLGSDTIVDRVLTCDKFTIPLNLFGTSESDYKPLPDVGATIGKDGILYATRRVDPTFGFITLTKNALRKTRSTDKICRVPTGSVMNDINAYSGRTKLNQRLPIDVTKQLDYYVAALSDYYRRLRDENARLVRERGSSLRYGDSFHRLLVESISDDESAVSHKVRRAYRRAPLYDYRIEVRLISTLMAKVGIKITDTHGGKAIVVSIIPQADAPRDKHGVYADVVIDGTTCNNRINPGRLYEQYINANGTNMVRDLLNTPNLDMLAAYDRIQHWQSIASIPTYEACLKTYNTNAEKISYAKYVLANDTHIWLPPNAAGVGIQMIADLEREFKLDYGPLTYRDLTGKQVTTVDPMFIGSLYMLFLEKIGDDWTSVAASKLQCFGLPGKLSGADKHTSQVREKAVRILGESEVRLLLATIGGEMVSKLLLLASSPVKQREAIRAILKAGESEVKSVMKDGPVPSDNRALLYIRILMYCFGSQVTG